MRTSSNRTRSKCSKTTNTHRTHRSTLNSSSSSPTPLISSKVQNDRILSILSSSFATKPFNSKKEQNKQWHNKYKTRRASESEHVIKKQLQNLPGGLHLQRNVP